MPVASYQELLVWQKSIDLVTDVYRVTKKFPREELYGLTNQLRRAAVSVPSNLAEGQGRGVGAEFRHHCRIAQGSLQESETQIVIAHRLDYIDLAEHDYLLLRANEIGKMNRGLIKAIRV